MNSVGDIGKALERYLRKVKSELSARQYEMLTFFVDELLIAELEAENERLSQLLHDEMRQLRAELEKRTAGLHYANAVCMEMKHELARRDEIIARLKEDAERLASTYVVEAFPHEWVCRGGCHHWARFGEQLDHAPDCPITLHRALMKELE